MVWFFVGVVLLASFFRLLYGVDFMDEATYVAVPYRFCLGDTPFVDEHSPIQTSALLTLPFVKLFYMIRGSAEGLVLFTRVLYLIFCCGVATVVAFGLKPLIGTRTAGLVSLVCVAFCPLGLSNLSYNTLSSGFFTAGLFLGLQHVLWGRSPRWLFLAGVAHGWAALALPSYVVPNLCYAAALWWLLEPGTRLRGVLSYAAGGVTACAAFTPWLIRFDGETLSNAYSHVHTAEGWMSRVRQFADQAWRFVPIKVELALALGSLWIALKYRRSFVSVTLLSILPLFPLIVGRPTGSTWYVAMLAGCGSLFLLLSWRPSLSKRLLWSVWLPSLCAGAITSLTSANGLVNSGLGLLPIVLVGTSLAVVLAREAADRSASRSLKALDQVFPALVIAVLLGYQRYPFGDDPVSELGTRVNSGPYKGLHTTPEKEGYLNAISDDLSAVRQGHDRILFVDHFPAGYLLTNMRPAVGCIWTIQCTRGGSVEDCMHEMRRDIAKCAGPDLAVFRMRSFPLSRKDLCTFEANDLDLALEKRFQRVVDRGSYTVLVMR
jgi:hypothetical protein